MNAVVNYSNFLQKLPAFIALTRLDRPIGIYLLLWPMLWALWFAAQGLPDIRTLLIFIAGTVLTRSAGCAINDYADRHFDAHVTRTSNRPLATGKLLPRDALLATAVLMGIAFLLVLMTNPLTIRLSIIALALAIIYPFCKRYTHLPQLVLGAAFGFAVPMAYAAQSGSIPASAWWLYASAIVWATAYDTLYAMADRKDDLKLGLKSSAILFGRHDLLIVATLQASMLTLLAAVGLDNERGPFFFLGLITAAGFATYQLWLARGREPASCIRAFLNNNWLGMVIFIALVVDYILTP